MKTIISTLALVLPLALVGCSQIHPISQDQLAANLEPLLKIEERLDQVKFVIQMLEPIGRISEGNSEKLEIHFDIYHVYYVASIVCLAEGKIESYLAHVELAKRELDSMEAILNEGLAKKRELEYPKGEPLPSTF